MPCATFCKQVAVALMFSNSPLFQAWYGDLGALCTVHPYSLAAKFDAIASIKFDVPLTDVVSLAMAS